MPVSNYNIPTGYFDGAVAGDVEVRNAFLDHLREKSFPCVAAKAALGLENVDLFIAEHIACPADDRRILSFLYGFVDRLRGKPDRFRSAVIVFRDASPMTEASFDRFTWSRLQALVRIDRERYHHDSRVSPDPSSPDFSYSLKEEAFYIIGMHAGSSRAARQSPFPALVFNPHAQFEELRKNGKYETLKTAIRKRDMLYSGSVNPLLSDFGEQSEVFQYSGLRHESDWVCPLQKNNHQDGSHRTA